MCMGSCSAIGSLPRRASSRPHAQIMATTKAARPPSAFSVPTKALTRSRRDSTAGHPGRVARRDFCNRRIPSRPSGSVCQFRRSDADDPSPRNMILDFAGENTAGKTTTLRVAASVWGNPDESIRWARVY